MVEADFSGPGVPSAQAPPTVTVAPVPAMASAVCDALLAAYAPTVGWRNLPPAAAVARFVDGQRRGLPHALPVMLGLFGLTMNLAPLLTRGRRFSRLPRVDRFCILDRWRRSPVAPIRNYVKFHEVFVGYCVHRAWSCRSRP